METIKLQVSEIKPYEKNAKKHDETQIKNVMESISKFGFVQPIVVDKDKVVIIGHCRLIAAKRLHMRDIDCVVADNLSEEDVKRLRLLDNKLNESEWDWDLLMEEIAELDFSDFDVDWELPEVGAKSAEDIVEDEPPALPEKAKSMPGDIYEFGDGMHRLICGDSTDAAVIELLMDGAKADLLLTDPPYNVDYVGKTKDALKIKNDKMDNDSFRQFLRDAFSSANAVMRNGAVFYIWHADSEGYNFRGACADVNWNVRECLIWNKNSMVMGRQDYQWKHEPCLYGWKDGASHLWASDRKQVTVLEFDRPTRADLHPTMKPLKLFGYQLSNNTHEGDKVLDIFGGSGTTLMACEQLNRKSYSCELDPRYVDVIVERYIKYKGTDEDVFLIRNGKRISYKELDYDQNNET